MNTCGVHVNLDQVRETVLELLKQRHVPIRDLEVRYPSIGKKFNQFLQLINKIKNSDAYDEVFKIIEKETRSLNSIDPGTIGAYFKGCLLPVSFPGNPSCSEICASSFQPPRTMDGWFSCGRIVVRARWKTEIGGRSGNSENKEDKEDNRERKNDFSVEIISEGDNPGYLLIDHTTLSEFPGFSDSEKTKLRRLGLTSCKLLSVSSSGKEYRELIGGFNSIDSLPSRVTRNESFSDPSSQVKNPWVAMFFFLVVLVGIGIFSLLQLSSQQDAK